VRLGRNEKIVDPTDPLSPPLLGKIRVPFISFIISFYSPVNFGTVKSERS
jgi:hypothetical protein